jgi:ABC-type sugar transport system substrate-binding protein
MIAQIWRRLTLAMASVVVLAACTGAASPSAPASAAAASPSPAASGSPASSQAGNWWTVKIDTKDPLWGLTAAKPNKPFKIGVAHVSLADQYYVALEYGIEQEAKANGLTVTKVVAAGGYDHLADQVRQIEDLAASPDVDVILTLVASEQGSKDAVARAVAAGKKVITMASVTASDKVYAQIAEDYTLAGTEQADYMCAHLSTGAKVAMLTGPTGASWSTLMSQGFSAQMAAKCPGVQIVSQQNSPVDPSQAQKITEDWLQRYPDLAAIFSVADAYAQGVVPAVQSAGKSSQILITTQGFTPWSKPALQAGQVKMAAANAPIILGRWSVQAAIHAMNGDPGPGRDTQLTAPMPPVTSETVGTASEVPQAGAFTPPGYKVQP